MSLFSGHHPVQTRTADLGRPTLVQPHSGKHGQVRSGVRKILAGFVGLLLVATTFSLGAAPAAASPESDVIQASPAPSTLDLANKQQILDVFNGINVFRANNGLEPVNFNVTAAEVAEDWSDYMATNQMFLHNPGYASDPRVANRWTRAGEVIAARWDTTGQSLVTQWENSPGHRSILSDPGFKTIGVGIFITGNKDYRNEPRNYTMYGTVNFFTFVQPPVGTYATAQDYFDGKPSLDVPPLSKVTTQSPTWDNSTGNYTIPAVTGVDYFVNQKKTPAGTHHSGWNRINIEARAQPGYQLFGTVSWSHTFVRPSTTVTPAPVVFTDKDGTAQDTITIPSTEGVEYTIGGTRTPAGTHPGKGYVSVYANAKPTYIIRDGATTRWTKEFKETPYRVTPAPVVFTDKDGTAKDTVTIPFTTGVEYLLAGKPTAKGVYTGKGAVTVTARARTDYVLEPGATAKWTTTFSSANAPYAPPRVSPFADVSTKQLFYKEMSWLAAQGISTGWKERNGTSTYRALVPVNRDAMAAFLYRAAGSPDYTPPKRSPFADVSTNQLFYKEMSWLAAQGISTGWKERNGTRTYRPLQPVNRDAMAAFLSRAAGSPDYTPPKRSPFADVSTNQLFYKEMSWLAAQGISTGWKEPNGTSTYRALQPVNRDAMAAFLYRADGRP
ncbi:CAP domain-containing protein [Arthrobacter flavus]|uniref:CAP domain-containing protein n=1 Tax=Arthrobacter flavus TaxID=95172 RepID=A0ABW4Q3E3_9MICC